MESHLETEQGAWSVPQCGFTIEYSLRVMDQVRLAVVDAFFSLPRGGAEIGGILLGRHDGRRVVISGFVDLACEHAKGPSFTLSPNDHSRLAELLAVARGNADGEKPVGWYHSHTRSDIFLSAEDLEIHKRYFPEPWQIALVMKPHTFQPTRAGFFFRDAGGVIRSTASYQEFEVGALSVRAASNGSAVVSAPPAVERQDEVPADAVEEEQPLQPEATEAVESEAPVPAFAQVAPPPARSRRLAIAVLLGLAAVAAAFQTRSLWGPRAEAAATQAEPKSNPTALFAGLKAMDREGQLVIGWDRQSAAIHQAERASLTIEDGPASKAVELDTEALNTGSFTYARQGGQVKVAMTLYLADGRRLREATTYLGTAPAPKPLAMDDEVRRQRDILDEQLKATQSRNKNLEKSVEDMRRELLREQRRRLGNQSPDTVK